MVVLLFEFAYFWLVDYDNQLHFFCQLYCRINVDQHIFTIADSNNVDGKFFAEIKFDYGFANYESVEMGKKDSFKVEKEAVEMAMNGEYGMVLITNSRDYGLDDIIFGPKEQHLFKQTTTPLMCINPRGDLYVLCW